MLSLMLRFKTISKQIFQFLKYLKLPEKMNKKKLTDL
jgi:hypothetical protein